MFTSEVDRYKFVVRFTHMRPEDCPLPGNRARQVATKGGVSYCSVYESNTAKGQPILVRVGQSLCSKHDTFEYETGRRIALTNAIREFPKHARTAIWQAYWESKEAKKGT